jgi:hypothetical protein
MISEQDLCSLHQVSVQDLHRRSPGKISVQDFYKSSLCTDIGLLARPLAKISIRDLSARSLYEISVQALYKKPSSQDVCKRPLGKISAGKIPVQDLYKRSLGKITYHRCTECCGSAKRDNTGRDGEKHDVEEEEHDVEEEQKR